VVGDRILLEQVLVNLIQNAIDATAGNLPDDRRLSIRVVAQPERFVVHVRDNGPGFSDSTQIFEPFYTTKTDGLGLGLSFCRNILDTHGGRLWANNRRDGGAELGFWLPIPEEH
jgi:C4-dicarboxylate-specific signal transduction histidine kinase